MTDKNQKSPNIRINKVYTRTGDSGKTRLIGGKERDKDDPRIETYGTVDELNSHIGLCREMLQEIDSTSYLRLIEFLHSVQNDLFNLGTQIASPVSEKSETLPKITVDAITNIEDEIDKANEGLSELTSFVLPGGSKINAQFHITRNVCRRAERRAVALSKKEGLDPLNLQYLNRLSDALFVWSRWVSIISDDEECLWKPNF